MENPRAKATERKGVGAKQMNATPVGPPRKVRTFFTEKEMGRMTRQLVITVITLQGGVDTYHVIDYKIQEKRLHLFSPDFHKIYAEGAWLSVTATAVDKDED